MPTKAKTRTGELPLSALHPHPKQIRPTLEEDVVRLTGLIQSQGVATRLHVYPHPDIKDDYLVVDGHHRLAACRRAELTDVPVEIHPPMTDAEAVHFMMTTGRGNKRTTQADEARGVQTLLDLGESVASVAKGQAMKQRTVKVLGWAAQGKDNAGSGLMNQTIPMDVAERLYDLEKSSGDDELYERAIAKIDPEAGLPTTAHYERIIAEAERDHRIEQLRADLIEAGAVEAPEEATYYRDGWGPVYGFTGDTADRIADGQQFRIAEWNESVQWWKQHQKSGQQPAEPELSEEELAEKQRLEDLKAALPTLSAGRVLTIVEAIHSDEMKSKVLADKLARDVLAGFIATTRYDYPSAKSFLGQVLGKDLDQIEERHQVREYLAAELPKLKLTQLAVITAVTNWLSVESQGNYMSLRNMRGFERDDQYDVNDEHSSWRADVYPYYKFLEQIGYELMPEEVEVMQMEAARRPYRDLALDLVEVPGEVTAECAGCKQTVVTGDGWAGTCDHCLDAAADVEDSDEEGVNQ